jgi:hypothetical protein
MEGVQSEQETSSPETTDTGDVSGARSKTVHEKLRGLLALRAELDRDIEALKRTADILDDAGP